MGERAGNNAPRECAYCSGDDPNCGFCEMGKPLDTQADWDRSWGRILGSQEWEVVCQNGHRTQFRASPSTDRMTFSDCSECGAPQWGWCLMSATDEKRGPGNSENGDDMTMADRHADELDDAELCEVCDSPYHLTENHDGPILEPKPGPKPPPPANTQSGWHGG